MTDASDGFRLRAEQVARAITPRTKLLIVNSPSNPSGAVMPADEFEKIYEVCRAKNIWLMTDECYSHFVYGEREAVFARQRAGNEAEHHRGRLALENFCHDRLAHRLRACARAADLRHDQDAEPVHLEPDFDRAICGAGSADRADGYGDRHAGGICAAPRLASLPGCAPFPASLASSRAARFTRFRMLSAHLGNGIADSTALCKQLLEREHLVAVPGDAFGTPGYIRLSYATSIERIEEGLRRLGKFFSVAEAAR